MSILAQSAIVSLFYACYCFIIHHTVWPLSISFSERLKKLPNELQHTFKNRAVSTAHAIVMFGFTLYYWLYLNPEMKIESESIGIQRLSLDCMMGYLWYDIIVELSGKKWQKDFMMHHLLGLASHLSTRISNKGAPAFYRCVLISLKFSDVFKAFFFFFFLY
jgi:hypothetical protein